MLVFVASCAFVFALVACVEIVKLRKDIFDIKMVIGAMLKEKGKS